MLSQPTIIVFVRGFQCFPNQQSSTLKLAATRIPDLVKNKYQHSHCESLRKLDDMILQEKDVVNALSSQAGESAPPVTSGASDPAAGTTQSRTLASPDYDGQPVPNFDRRVEFEERPLADFNSSQTFLRCLMICFTLDLGDLKLLLAFKNKKPSPHSLHHTSGCFALAV